MPTTARQKDPAPPPRRKMTAKKGPGKTREQRAAEKAGQKKEANT